MTVVAVPTLDIIRQGNALHLDHYGGRVLDIAVLGGTGIWSEIVHLEGDLAGRRERVMDASGAYASACLGAGHPAVLAALTEGAAAGQATDEIGALERSRFLLELMGPDGLLTDHFPYGEYVASGRSSGSEGLELALRLALETRIDMTTTRPGPASGRNIILAFEGAWHGWTSGLVPLLNRRHYRLGLPTPEGGGPAGVAVRHLPFGDYEALAEAVNEYGPRLLATVVEPIQGDAGIIEPPDGYLRAVADLTQTAGGLVIADEVLTFAKTGAPLAMRDSQGPVRTDITVIGKSVGMGAAALSVVIARRDLKVRATGAVSTSDLRPLASSVARMGLEHIRANRLFENSAERGLELKTLLHSELVETYPHLFREVRGTASLLGVELTERAAQSIPQLRNCLLRGGVLVEFMAGAGRRSGQQRYVFPTLRVVPPLNISPSETRGLVDCLSAGVAIFEAREMSV